VIVHTLDVIRALRDTQWTVVSGFQSPTEQECLEILLRGERPVIVCPARSVQGMRIPAAWKPAIAADRMLITSPFEKSARRATAATAEERNHFVVSLADAVFIPHAAPGGSLERLCQTIPATGKPLWTLDDPANAALIALGARPISPSLVPPTGSLCGASAGADEEACPRAAQSRASEGSCKAAHAACPSHTIQARLPR
jgi:hypothetical protein